MRRFQVYIKCLRKRLIHLLQQIIIIIINISVIVERIEGWRIA